MFYCEKVSSKRNTRSRMATTAQTAPRLGATPAVIFNRLCNLGKAGSQRSLCGGITVLIAAAAE